MLALLLATALAAPCPVVEPLTPPSRVRLPDPPSGPVGEGVAALRVAVVGEDDVGGVGVEVCVLGPEGLQRCEATGANGDVLFSDLPVADLIVVGGGVTLVGVRMVANRTRRQVIEVRGNTSLVGPTPGVPPSSSTWIRYARSSCLGPCEAFEATVAHGGQLTFEGHAYVRVEGEARRMLSARQVARLQEALDCVHTLPSFGSYDRTDHVWTRVEVWPTEGEPWSWVWYSGDERAPYDALDKVRRRLERAMGVERFK